MARVRDQLALAAGFACVGEVLLRRRSSDARLVERIPSRRNGRVCGGALPPLARLSRRGPSGDAAPLLLASRVGRRRADCSGAAASRERPGTRTRPRSFSAPPRWSPCASPRSTFATTTPGTAFRSGRPRRSCFPSGAASREDGIRATSTSFATSRIRRSSPLRGAPRASCAAASTSTRFKPVFLLFFLSMLVFYVLGAARTVPPPARVRSTLILAPSTEPLDADWAAGALRTCPRRRCWPACVAACLRTRATAPCRGSSAA